MNKHDTAPNCTVSHGEEQYDNSNPASIYIQFEIEHADIVRMMTTRKNNLSAAKSARLLRAAAAKLREEEGGEESADEVTFLSAAFKRRKEVHNVNSSAAGSAPKKKRSMAIPTHERFKPGVAYLAWPRGSNCGVSPDHPRVKWEVVQIYEHLVSVFGGDEAAAKMNHLTAPRPNRRRSVI